MNELNDTKHPAWASGGTMISGRLLRSIPTETWIGITFIYYIKCNGVTAIKQSMMPDCTEDANLGRKPLPRKRKALVTVPVLVTVVTVVVV